MCNVCCKFLIVLSFSKFREFRNRYAFVTIISRYIFFIYTITFCLHLNITNITHGGYIRFYIWFPWFPTKRYRQITDLLYVIIFVHYIIAIIKRLFSLLDLRDYILYTYYGGSIKDIRFGLSNLNASPQCLLFSNFTFQTCI